MTRNITFNSREFNRMPVIVVLGACTGAVVMLLFCTIGVIACRKLKS